MPQVRLGDIELHYERPVPAGARAGRPPLLLLAGMASDSASWAPIAPALAERFDTIAPDNRCTGRTRPMPAPTSREAMVGDALALLDALGIDRVAILGHSMGAMLGWALAAAKLAQYHAFNRGDAALMLRIAEDARIGNEERAPWHAMRAFGHEQLHDLDRAEAAAGRALELEPGEPWAHHAIAHVHLGRGTLEAGRRFLEERSDHWTGLNSFMFTHNWWHLALFEIASGRPERALGVYDERCWGVEPGYSQDQVGAVSLLARLECAGVEVGERWAALRPHLEARARDVEQPFLALQYLFGLARAGSPVADALMDEVRRQPIEPVVAEDRELWEEVGVPVAEGVLAHARGRYGAAAEALSVPWRERVRLGGSHAQRDLFEQLRLDALWRSGRRAEALRLMRARLAFEPDNPLLIARIAEVEAGG